MSPSINSTVKRLALAALISFLFLLSYLIFPMRSNSRASKLLHESA